jgi:hypothetical protein
MEDGEDNYPGLNLGGIPIVSRPGSADRKRAFQSVPLKLASGHDCPRCGGDVPEPGHKGEWEGARSRTDNETEICSNCGRQEAGENMAGGKCTPQSNWPVKPIFHALPRSGLTWEEMRGFGSAPVMPFPGPKELPDLRLHLLDRWQPGGPFERMVSQRHAIAMRDTPELWSASERFTIHNASLWWVKEDMVHITTAAARTMPDDVTARDVELPAEQKRGLVCFEVPWTGADSVHEDNTVNVHALTWGAVKVDGIPCLSITMYEYFDFTQGLGPRELSAALATGVIGEGITDRELHKGPKSVMDQAVRLRGGAWVLLGRTDWPMKEKWMKKMCHDTCGSGQIEQDIQWRTLVRLGWSDYGNPVPNMKGKMVTNPNKLSGHTDGWWMATGPGGRVARSVNRGVWSTWSRISKVLPKSHWSSRTPCERG